MHVWEDGDHVCVRGQGLCMCQKAGTMYVWEDEDYVCVGGWGLWGVLH